MGTNAAEEEAVYELEEGANDDDSTLPDYNQGSDQNLDTIQEEPAAESTEDPAAETSNNDVEEYGEKVQKRIKKLTRKLRDAERERDSAFQYAQGVQHEMQTHNQQLRGQMENRTDQLFDQYTQNVDTKLDSAKIKYVKAHEDGDVTAMMGAQEEIAQASVEKENLRRVAVKRGNKPPQQFAQQQQATMNPQVQQQQFAQQAQQAQPDEGAESWAEENEWFGSDKVMTYAAMGLHRDLTESEGIDPKSDLYYNELNKRMRESFPHKFESQSNGNENGQTAKPNQTVAGATRSRQPSQNKKVRLTQSEVRMANRLGVPLEDYAKHVKRGN
jgi:hypothetical protein